MAKKPKVSHRNCAWCSVDGICVPQRLHDDFEAQLGEKRAELDLFSWYEKRTSERKAEMIVVGDIWTTWREEFKAELGFRGWIKPVYRPVKQMAPIQAERLARLGQTMGRTPEETRKHLQSFIDYKQKQAGD